MTQEEKWLKNYKEVMEFMEREHRNPSKFVDSERGLRNWIKATRKRMNAGELKENNSAGVRRRNKEVEHV